ncbi:MAG: hypothetical protein ACLGI6_12835, partial [Gammaproteobacteria bacterium]
MTITTAKRARVRPRLAPVATAVMALLAAPASRAGWDVRPALQVRETFTDNVGLQPKPLDDSQLVTELIPSLALVHRGPRFQMEGLAKLYHYEFSHEQVSGTARTQHEVNARAHAELVDDL